MRLRPLTDYLGQGRRGSAVRPVQLSPDGPLGDAALVQTVAVEGRPGAAQRLLRASPGPSATAPPGPCPGPPRRERPPGPAPVVGVHGGRRGPQATALSDGLADAVTGGAEGHSDAIIGVKSELADIGERERQRRRRPRLPGAVPGGGREPPGRGQNEARTRCPPAEPCCCPRYPRSGGSGQSRSPCRPPPARRSLECTDRAAQRTYSTVTPPAQVSRTNCSHRYPDAGPSFWTVDGLVSSPSGNRRRDWHADDCYH